MKTTHVTSYDGQKIYSTTLEEQGGIIADVGRYTRPGKGWFALVWDHYARRRDGTVRLLEERDFPTYDEALAAARMGATLHLETGDHRVRYHGTDTPGMEEVLTRNGRHLGFVWLTTGCMWAAEPYGEGATEFPTITEAASYVVQFSQNKAVLS